MGWSPTHTLQQVTQSIYKVHPRAQALGWITILVIMAACLVPFGANALLNDPIRRVMVVGGTHGNEYTGVWCVKALEKQRDKLEAKYPTLELQTIIGNPEAHKQNKRFIDTDLNREFTSEKLCSQGDGDTPTTLEAARAKELDAILGSKCSDEPAKFDVAIDLHSTTTNMGTTIIFPEGDELMAQAAAYVIMKQPQTRCLIHPLPERGQRPTVPSAAMHGLTIEVGPVPVGLLRHDAVEKTETALHSILEFLERRNRGDPVDVELQKAFVGGTVPCFRSAPAKQLGEISGKIRWPSDPANPNFPSWMVHKAVQDRDFKLIRKGDPLFVAQDGSIINYEGSHGDEVYLVFVNEAGYYYASSGTGIGVAVASKFRLDGSPVREPDKKKRPPVKTATISINSIDISD